MAGKVTLSCLLALSIAVANGLTGGLLGSSTTNACVASSTCVPSYTVSSPSVFGDLPVAASTNQPPVQSVRGDRVAYRSRIDYTQFLPISSRHPSATDSLHQRRHGYCRLQLAGGGHTR